MIDTIKLLLNIPDPSLLDGSRFEPITIMQLTAAHHGRTHLRPSAVYAKVDKYMPSLAMFKRPTKFGDKYQLSVEFSAPKMVFGNNFEELAEQDFELVLMSLQRALFELVGYCFSIEQLANANISAWHPSKNVIFTDYTSCQTILSTIAKLDVSRIYDFQKTDFRDGHALHIHCNSLDIAFYDKMADLRQSKKSDKRAIENDSGIQLSLLERLNKFRPLEVFRYEVRLSNRRSVKQAFPDLDSWTLRDLFSQHLCQEVLIQHWNKLTEHIDMLALDTTKPAELLQNYLLENKNTPTTALAAVASMLIANQVGMSGLRNVLEAHYGTQAWYRIKALIRPPKAHRFSHFRHIDKVLEEFMPVRMSDFKQIENTSK
jgi:hypothetical protein